MDFTQGVKVVQGGASRLARLAHHRSEHDTERQVPHGKHMLSLITAASVGWGEEALCLFCSEPQRVGDSGTAALH